MSGTQRLPNFHTLGRLRAGGSVAMTPTLAILRDANFDDDRDGTTYAFLKVTTDGNGITSFTPFTAFSVGTGGFQPSVLIRLDNTRFAMPVVYATGSNEQYPAMAIVSIDGSIGDFLLMGSQTSPPGDVYAAIDGGLLPNGNLLLVFATTPTTYFIEIAVGSGLTPSLVGSTSVPAVQPPPGGDRPSLQVRQLTDSVMVLAGAQVLSVLSLDRIFGPVDTGLHAISAFVGAGSYTFATIQDGAGSWFDQVYYSDGSRGPLVPRTNFGLNPLNMFNPPRYAQNGLFISGTSSTTNVDQPVSTQHRLLNAREATGYPVGVSNDLGFPYGSGVQVVIDVLTMGGSALVTDSHYNYYVVQMAGVLAPAMRLNQRNDGLGVSGHARLISGSTPNGASSGQLSSAPRIGTANIYDPGAPN